MQEHIVEVKVVAKRSGHYTNLVFQVLKNSDEFIICTVLPNWGIPEINVGDIGFLQYNIIRPGDEYLDIETGEIKLYRYRQNYVNNFILSSEIKNKQQELIL